MTRNLGMLLKQLNRLIDASFTAANEIGAGERPIQYELALPINFLPVERLSATSIAHCPLYENLQPLAAQEFDAEFWKMKVYDAANTAHETEEDRSEAVCFALGLMYASFDEESVCTMDSAFNEIAMGFLNSAIMFVRDGSKRLKNCLPDIVRIPSHIREEHVECYEYSEAQLMDEARGHVRAVKSRVLKTPSKSRVARDDLPSQDEPALDPDAVDTTRKRVRFGDMTKAHDGGPDLQDWYTRRKYEASTRNVTNLESVEADTPERHTPDDDPPDVDNTEEEDVSVTHQRTDSRDRFINETLALALTQSVSDAAQKDGPSRQDGELSSDSTDQGNELSPEQESILNRGTRTGDGENAMSPGPVMRSSHINAEKPAQDNHLQSVHINDRVSLSPPIFEAFVAPMPYGSVSSWHGDRYRLPLQLNPVDTLRLSMDNYDQPLDVADDGITGQDFELDGGGWDKNNSAPTRSDWPAHEAAASSFHNEPVGHNAKVQRALSPVSMNPLEEPASSLVPSDPLLPAMSTARICGADTSNIVDQGGNDEPTSESKKRRRSQRSDEELDEGTQQDISPEKKHRAPNADTDIDSTPITRSDHDESSQGPSTPRDLSTPAAFKTLKNYYVRVESHGRKEHIYYKRGVFTYRIIISLDTVKTDAVLTKWTSRHGRNIGERIIPKSVPRSQLTAAIMRHGTFRCQNCQQRILKYVDKAKRILTEESKEYEVCDKPGIGKKCTACTRDGRSCVERNQDLRNIPCEVYDEVDNHGKEPEPLQITEDDDEDASIAMELHENGDVIRYLPGAGPPATAMSVAEVRQLKLDILDLQPTNALSRADKAVQRRRVSRANQRKGLQRDPSKDKFCKKSTRK
ncbi:hypothetical protein CALCODRAFT_507542 [Calocera cornea HHB12733]|uniref:Uncharacterized protein n=1 Tax=Calocera cornea HHB12733 TaxID=1353952 RepID=A0A165HHZ5_9BASI|nr:hypothetical protein CALCODRAFT_507542 [Calocera cornea HHB12733]